MSLTLFRVLSFCLVPVGVFILMGAIRMLKGVFNGRVMAEIPFTRKEVEFQISRPGVYAVWQEGRLFRKTPVDKFKLKLTDISTSTEVSMPKSFFSPYLNGLDTGRMEMYRFKAHSGRYRLTVTEGTGISLFEKLASKLIPAKPVDYGKYFIQIRESRPLYCMFLAIPLFAFSALCIIGGLVAGFTAQGILHDLGI